MTNSEAYGYPSMSPTQGWVKYSRWGIKEKPKMIQNVSVRLSLQVIVHGEKNAAAAGLRLNITITLTFEYAISCTVFCFPSCSNFRSKANMWKCLPLGWTISLQILLLLCKYARFHAVAFRCHNKQIYVVPIAMDVSYNIVRFKFNQTIHSQILHAMVKLCLTSHVLFHLLTCA